MCELMLEDAGVLPEVADVLRSWNFQHHTRLDRTPIAIGYWLGSLDYIPTRAELQHRYGLSRASAYRWHAFAVRAGARRGLEERT